MKEENPLTLRRKQEQRESPENIMEFIELNIPDFSIKIGSDTYDVHELGKIILDLRNKLLQQNKSRGNYIH